MPVLPRKWIVVWSIVTVAVLVNILGLVWNLYAAIGWFDEVVHAYTTFALILPLILWLYGTLLIGAHDHRFRFMLLVVLIGLGVGAAWEIAEWGYDQMRSGDVILGKFDTMTDLLMDAIGAFCASWLAASMVTEKENVNEIL